MICEKKTTVKFMARRNTNNDNAKPWAKSPSASSHTPSANSNPRHKAHPTWEGIGRNGTRCGQVRWLTPPKMTHRHCQRCAEEYRGRMKEKLHICVDKYKWQADEDRTWKEGREGGRKKSSNKAQQSAGARRLCAETAGSWDGGYSTRWLQWKPSPASDEARRGNWAPRLQQLSQTKCFTIVFVTAPRGE